MSDNVDNYQAVRPAAVPAVPGVLRRPRPHRHRARVRRRPADRARPRSTPNQKAPMTPLPAKAILVLCRRRGRAVRAGARGGSPPPARGRSRSRPGTSPTARPAARISGLPLPAAGTSSRTPTPSATHYTLLQPGSAGGLRGRYQPIRTPRSTGIGNSKAASISRPTKFSPRSARPRDAAERPAVPSQRSGARRHVSGRRMQRNRCRR